MNITMVAPSAYANFKTRTGTSYTANSAGVIANVALADVRDLNNMGCITVSAGDVGAPGTDVTAVELGDGIHHTTILTFGAGAVLGAIAGGASLGLGFLVYTLPAGAQIIRASRMAVGIADSGGGHISANTPTVGLGTVVASGAVAVLSGTATFQNINVGKAAAACDGTPTVQTEKATSSPFELITETGGVKSIYFNAACAWSASGDPAAILSGTVAIDWATLA